MANAKWEIHGSNKHLNVNYTVSFLIHTLNAHSFQIPLTRGLFVFLLPVQTFVVVVVAAVVVVVVVVELFQFVSIFLSELV